MPSQEDIIEQERLLQIHRQTLSLYLQQRAKQGSAYISPGISHGIIEARNNIRHIKEILRNWGAEIEDHPNDEDTLSASIYTSGGLAKQLFSEAFKQFWKGDFFDAKRRLEMTLAIDPFYPLAEELLTQAKNKIEQQATKNPRLSLY